MSLAGETSMTKSLLIALAEVLIVAAAAYALAAPPGAAGWTVGGSYAKYVTPLLIGLLAALLCWGLGKL
jgi:hypothetical protein